MTEGKAGQQHQHIALLQWSAAEKYAQHLLICINFPGPGLQVEVVRIITCLLSPITSRLTYPEQSATKWGARLTFPIIWSSGAHFPLISSELGTEQTHQWKQSGEAREGWVPPQPGSEVVRRMLLAFLPAPVWHLADLSIRLRVLSVCHLNTAGTISAL